jgi:hypothetical protein
MQAKQTYEADDPITAEYCPSLDFDLKPAVRLENITTFDLDDSKPTDLLGRIPLPAQPQLSDQPNGTHRYI